MIIPSYFVHYVEKCKRKVKLMSSLEDLLRFIIDFKTNDDNWIDAIYDGRRMYLSDDIEVSDDNK